MRPLPSLFAPVALPLVLAACERHPTPPPARDVAAARTDATTAAVVPPRDPASPSGIPEADAGPQTVLVVRLRNVDTTPLRILTNPDLNEMIRVQRVNVSAGTSDRSALYADGTRVSLFPVGRMQRCDSDAGPGYGGLGQAGTITLAPGEAVEVARWDGVQREEVLDPQRGVCLREFAPSPGRYRFQLDQPQLEGRPQCVRAMTRVPIETDGGIPEVEIRCRNAAPTPPAGARPQPAEE